MAIKSHARKDVTKKLLSLCVGIALLSGTGGVLADAADQTVAGNLDGTAVTGNTTFNTVTVKSNTEAVVKNEYGQETTITNSSGGGWKLVAGAQDHKDKNTYEVMGGNVVNVSSDTDITIATLTGGVSQMPGAGDTAHPANSVRYYSVINNVVNIGCEEQHGGTLRAEAILGGESKIPSGQSPDAYQKAYPVYNVINLKGMTITGQETKPLRIAGGQVSGRQGSSYGNVINIQGDVVLKQAQIYGADNGGIAGWSVIGGHACGNRINLSGQANLNEEVSLQGVNYARPYNSSRCKNLDNILNIGYKEIVIESPSKQLPDQSDLAWDGQLGKYKGRDTIDALSNKYNIGLKGEVALWENNKVSRVSAFSSLKIWAMKNDGQTPALDVKYGFFSYYPFGTNGKEVGSIIDLTYLTSGVDYGTKYYDNENSTSTTEFDRKLKIIEVASLTEDKRDKLIFAKATPNQTIPIIVAKSGRFGNGNDYGNQADIKANTYRYRYDLPEIKKINQTCTLQGYYTGEAVFDAFSSEDPDTDAIKNDIVWKTSDITVGKVSISGLHWDESGANVALQLENYGYRFNDQTNFHIDMPDLPETNHSSSLLSANKFVTLIDGSGAKSVTGLDQLPSLSHRYNYQLNEGAVEVSADAATKVSEDQKSLHWGLGNPISLSYKKLDCSKTVPVASLKAGSTYDLSQTKVDLTHMQVEGIASLPSGSSQRTLLAVNGEQTGLAGANITGGEERTLERKGTTTELIGKADIAENGDLVYALSRRIQPQTHNVILGQEAGLAALIDDNDLVLDTMKNLDKAEKGLQTFATVGGGENRYKTGSHITTNVWRGQAGAVWKRQKNGVEQELGIFYEYGDGSYRTYAENHGGGKLSYKGAGVLFKRTEADGRYGEVSLRVGRASNDARNLLHDGVGNTIAYKANGMYHAFQAGLGRITQRGRGNSFDTYLRYFHTHLNGDSFEAGGCYDVDGLSSHILRIGSRWQHQDRNWEYYAGLAYQYEFSGNAYGLAEGNIVESASLRGGSVRLEYGMRLETNRWRVALNASDYAGQHKGYNGNISVTYKF